MAMQQLKLTDLMVRDWVNYTGKDFNEFTDRISGITSGCVTLEKEMIHRSIEKIHPIPLTEDILKLNGFVLDIRNNRYYRRVNGDDVWVKLPKENAMYPYVDIIYSSLAHCPEDVTEVSHSNELLFPEKVYVHQFQQVLRICGLNEFADNLKLEEQL